MEAIPDVDVLLSMEVEELAGAMLPHLARLPKGDFHRHNICSEAHWNGAPSSYAGWQEEAHQAFIEAFVWLENHGLVVPKPGSDTWSIVSRAGRQIVANGGFADFVSAEHFPKELVHPLIRETVWRLFIRGEYAAAVFQAMRAVEIEVRNAAGLPAKSHGVPMIREAFNKNGGPLADMDADEAEREALASLFAGAIGSYKNPHSHRNVPLDDPAEAIEMVMLASHLLRIVEARRRELAS